MYPGVGTWTGKIADRARGDGTLQVTLTIPGSDHTYHGTWTTTFTADGTATGTASASTAIDPLPLLLLCQQGGSIAIMASIQSTHMTGSYFASNCGSLTGGSIDLVRQ